MDMRPSIEALESVHTFQMPSPPTAGTCRQLLKSDGVTFNGCSGLCVLRSSAHPGRDKAAADGAVARVVDRDTGGLKRARTRMVRKTRSEPTTSLRFFAT